MTRYKLSLPGPGEYLHSDDGTVAFIADTAEEAKALFEDWHGERPEWVHSHIARGRIAYKSDVENGDVHDGCEPGDTTFDYLSDDGRELHPSEIRVWEIGPPRVFWSIQPLPFEPVDAEEIPVGTSVHHSRLGSGKTLEVPRRVSPSRAVVAVAFGRPQTQTRRVCSVATLAVLPSHDWPPVRRQLTVAGEVIAESANDGELERLRREKVAEHVERWKREQLAREAA